ncbi:MAG: AgmX/PglI C-terminal domain-containing protein [bacterium]
MKANDKKVEQNEEGHGAGARALEVTALYGDTPQRVQHFRTTRGGRVTLLSGLMLVCGVVLTVGGAAAFGSQVYAAKRQEAQRAKVLAFVQERGLPEKYVPGVRTHRTTELAGGICFVSGLFLVLLGGLRAREERMVPSFTIGEDPKSTFNTPMDGLPSSRFPLIAARDGDYVLSFTPHMSGTVTVPGGEPQQLPELVAGGAARPAGISGAYSYALPAGVDCSLRLGAVTFVVRSVLAEDEPGRATVPALLAAKARQPLSMTTAGAGAVALAFLLLFQLKPTTADAMEADSVSRYENRRIRQLLCQARKDEEVKRAAEKPKPSKPSQVKPTSRTKSVTGIDDDRLRRRSSSRNPGDGGARSSRARGGRAGMLGVLNTMSKKMASMMSLDTAISREAEDSLAALDGYTQGSNDILDGLNSGRMGPRNGAGHVSLSSGWSTQRGGGDPFDTAGPWNPDGRLFPIGVPKRGKLADPIQFPPSRVEVVEGIDAATLQRYIRMQRPAVKFCFVSKALAERPRAAGTVKVTFVISPRGKVLKASVTFTSLHHPATERCIANAIRRIQFPDTGGRTAFVTYPFRFRAVGRREPGLWPPVPPLSRDHHTDRPPPGRSLFLGGAAAAQNDQR